MAEKQSYIQEAADYYREHRWRERMLAARIPRSLMVKGTTLWPLEGRAPLASSSPPARRVAARSR